MSVEAFRKQLNTALTKREHTIMLVDIERKALQEARKNRDNYLHAQKITQEVAKNLQEYAHQQISRVVTKCLSTIFAEDAYEFKIKFFQRRGKTEAELLFVRDGQEIDPCTAAGGGVVDVTAFALRLAALILTKPRRRRLIIADEPFRFLSRGYRDKVRELLESLSKEMGIQFILTTHSSELMLGKVIEV